MEFKDRQTQYPGRVKLKNVSTGVETTYDVTLAEGVVTEAGTPLVKSTFDQMKSDILNDISSNPNLKGAQGEKGDRGLPGNSNAKTLLVGTNTAGQEGWYKLGTFNVPVNWDYHAKWLITSTCHGKPVPSGEIDIDFRHENPAWARTYAAWTNFSGEHPEYIKYYAASDGTVTFYAYVPGKSAFYRIDILAESNRDNYINVFVPSVAYGGIFTERYGPSAPGIALEQASSGSGSINVEYFSGASTYYGKTYGSNLAAQWWYVTVGDRVLNFVKFGLNVSGDHWFRIPLGNAVSISCLPFRNTTSGYTPGFVCWSDEHYTFIGLDENNMNGVYVTIVQ